jgi:hypothetical protein
MGHDQCTDDATRRKVDGEPIQQAHAIRWVTNRSNVLTMMLVARRQLPPRMSTGQIEEHQRRHRCDMLPFDSRTPIDLGKPFVCPTLTPLYYTRIWNELSDSDRLRHTQLSGLSFNELIAWFEHGFSATLRSLMHCDALPADVRELFPAFIDDESRHQRMWWALNRLADPARYERRSETPSITRIAPVGRMMMRWLARRPIQYPVAVWLMLVLEEHANEIARRCAQRRPDEIEPHFAAAYLAHVRDETRHVQIDWHLLDHLWPRLNNQRRRINAWIFRQVLHRLLFRAEHAAMSVARALANERPHLQIVLSRIRGELRGVGTNPDFRAMMFSPEVAPIATHLIERYPELEGAFA